MGTTEAVEIVKVAFESLEECQEYLNIAQNFSYDLDLQCGSKIIDGKSFLGIMAFGLKKKLYLKISTNDRESIDEFLDKIAFCVVEENICEAI